jgi:arylsulfatase B
MQSACQEYNPIVDLWNTNGESEGPAFGLNNTQYEEYVFRDRVMQIINNMTDQSPPLFLVYTPHVAHCPLQVPQEQLAKFNLENDEGLCSSQTPYIFPGSTQADYRCRSQYAAMVNLLDTVLGNITGLLKSKGLWDETLMVLSADNGGPLDVVESGANNNPLRGGKYSEFEGGIRANSFVSGGYLPESVRGTKLDGLMHIADYYATFAALAGVDPTDHTAAAAGLPPIDSLNMWPLISGQNLTSPRTEIPVSAQTLIQGPWKLITGSMPYATWQGTQYPNASSNAHPVSTSINCGTSGCLFNTEIDPTEHTDFAAQYPQIVQQMNARLQELKKGYWNNNDTGTNICPAGISMPCACWAALNKWNGFFGPYQL